MGKLNILQHKSWHVYSEANRERVRKDEEAAREKDEAQRERSLQAEREARLQLLRARKKTAAGTETTSIERVEVAVNAVGQDDVGSSKPARFSLFEPEEKKAKAALSQAAEAEAQKRLKKKEYEDKFTWYLGETKDGKKEKPWYAALELPSKAVADTVGHGTDRKEVRISRKKELDDPLTTIVKATSFKKGGRNLKPSGTHKRVIHRSLPRAPSSNTVQQPVSSPGGSKSVEQLREERRLREKAERSREEAMLESDNSTRIGTSMFPAGTRSRGDTEDGSYSAQYNPAFTRRNQIPDGGRYRPY
ncbi:hypothetical protein HDU85_003814 [Gaertneriomyces sp. JEL0708]|nr:hypothetical protein HDU85_003814 [Gaertneriomyces sp. JEL0708]